MLSSPSVTPTSRNFNLLQQLIRRDFAVRFTGSALGAAWAVLQPLTLVVLYWFVFTFMIPQPPGRTGTYVYFLIAGLVPWMAFSEGLMRSTTTIVDNDAIVRRLAFRSELLVIVPNASAIVFEVIGFLLFLGVLAANGLITRYIVVLPLAILFQFAIQTGIGWILAATYVFFRDLAQIIGFLLSMIFYLSPILYSVPNRFHALFLWNPLTPLLGLFRSALLGDPLPPAVSIVFLAVFAAAVFTGGLTIFRRTQPIFVDVI